MLALLERSQCFVIIALNPACLVEANRLPTALCAILVQQAILNHLELQLPHGADNLAVVKLVDKQLSHSLVHELFNALVELFGLHRVVVLDILEHLGREAWQALEVQFLALSERVANLEDAVVGQTYDIAGIDLIDDLLFLCHKCRWGRESVGFAAAHMLVVLVAPEHTGAHLDKGDAAAVIGVHVGMNLEHKACELFFFGVDHAFFGSNRPR